MKKTITDKNQKYLEYLNEHVKNVQSVWRNISNRLSGPYWLDDWFYFVANDKIKEHDKSKYEGLEFCGYRQFFYPTNEQEKSQAGFDRAWNHHQKTNDHHWEYWLLIGEKGSLQALEMDLPCILEMLCDWAAMSIKFKNLPSEWFADNRERIILHENTRTTVLHWLPLFDNVYELMVSEAEALLK